MMGALARHDQVHGLADGLRVGRGPGPGQGLVFRGIVIDLGHLHVERQIDQHRPGPPAAGRAEGLAHDRRDSAGLVTHQVALATVLAMVGDIHALEGSFAE